MMADVDYATLVVFILAALAVLISNKVISDKRQRDESARDARDLAYIEGKAPRPFHDKEN